MTRDPREIEQQNDEWQFETRRRRAERERVAPMPMHGDNCACAACVSERETPPAWNQLEEIADAH